MDNTRKHILNTLKEKVVSGSEQDVRAFIREHWEVFSPKQQAMLTAAVIKDAIDDINAALDDVEKENKTANALSESIEALLDEEEGRS